MLSMLICVTIGFMFYFVNTLYFVFVLLISIICILFHLFLYNVVSSVFSIMVALVYIGAIIVFIGYVCAVSPNPLFVSRVPFYCLFLFLCLFFFLGVHLPYYFSYESFVLADFFYVSPGFQLFSLVVFMLFMLLVVVSSQYFVPNGPFRSV